MTQTNYPCGFVLNIAEIRTLAIQKRMDWRTTNFDWNRARAFLVTAEEGSFSAAARALDTTQPTIGRQVAALEEELSVTLFERVGRGLQLTATGLELVEHARAMGDAASRLSVVAAGQSLSLEGVVSIAASEAVAVYMLTPIVSALRLEYPGIEIEIVASISVSDLLRREADIAIRNFQPTEPDLVARKLWTSQARLYAAPGYLERIGNPRTPAELSRAEFMGFDRGDAMLKGLNALGLDLTERNFPIVSANQLVQWELTKRGSGISVMLEEIGDAEPRVRRVLPDLPSIPVPMWLATHRELRTSRRVRTVFDRLAESLMDLANEPG